MPVHSRRLRKSAPMRGQFIGRAFMGHPSFRLPMNGRNTRIICDQAFCLTVHEISNFRTRLAGQGKCVSYKKDKVSSVVLAWVSGSFL